MSTPRTAGPLRESNLNLDQLGTPSPVFSFPFAQQTSHDPNALIMLFKLRMENLNFKEQAIQSRRAAMERASETGSRSRTEEKYVLPPIHLLLEKGLIPTDIEKTSPSTSFLLFVETIQTELKTIKELEATATAQRKELEEEMKHVSNILLSRFNERHSALETGTSSHLNDC